MSRGVADLARGQRDLDLLGQGLLDVRAYIINFFFEISVSIFQQLRIVHKYDCGKYSTKYIFCMYSHKIEYSS